MVHYFVVNPISLTNRQDFQQFFVDIEDYLPEGSGSYRVYFSRRPRDAVAVVRSYVMKHSSEIVRVYAVGGDGILFDCLNGIIGLENAELANIPYGSSNDFLRSFGPGVKELFRDIQLQLLSPAIPTDVISTGRAYALNHCTIGIESRAIAALYGLSGHMSRSKFSKFISPAYSAMAIFSALRDESRYQDYEVVSDGENLSDSYSAISIFNGGFYGDTFSPCPDACPSDGVLDVLLAKKLSLLQIVTKISDFVHGKYHKHPESFSHKLTHSITVKSERPLYVALDGEIFYEQSLDIKIIPNAIRFVSINGQPYLSDGSYTAAR
ncbi:MAG: hypothetical protein LBN97_03440 [Oscillospiraceae bacterium]|jgi:diacylglycerol kinase family enzyme|nr:hypothetical protein [Oscillospiraceae bacterium]